MEVEPAHGTFSSSLCAGGRHVCLDDASGGSRDRGFKHREHFLGCVGWSAVFVLKDVSPLEVD